MNRRETTSEKQRCGSCNGEGHLTLECNWFWSRMASSDAFVAQKYINEPESIEFAQNMLQETIEAYLE